MSILSIFNSLASSVFNDWQQKDYMNRAGVTPNSVVGQPQLPQTGVFPPAPRQMMEPQAGYPSQLPQEFQTPQESYPVSNEPQPQETFPVEEELIRSAYEPDMSKGGEIYRHYTTEEKAKLIEQTGEIRAGSLSKGKYEFYGKGKFGEVAFEIEAKDIPKEYLNPELTEFESDEEKEAFIDRVKSGIIDIGGIPIKKFKRVSSVLRGGK